MEKALAAFHQARPRHSVSLVYGSRHEQIGLFVRCNPVDRDAVLEPIIAVYPQASVSLADDWSTAGDRKTWGSNIELTPELFPILRHAQFEDMLNHNFADPVSGLLRSILPDADLECRIEITVRPASRHRCHQARNAVKLLDREFLRKHHHIAAYFARRISRPGRWYVAWLFGLIARCTPQHSHTTLETSTSRLHEREEDLQAAAEKLGCHLFETQLHLTVAGRPAMKAQAHDRLCRMVGALGAFTKSRLAMFESAPTRRRGNELTSAPGFLLSHEELATLRSRFDDATHTLTLSRENAEVARGDLRTPEGRAAIEDAIDAHVTRLKRGRPRIVASDGHSFSDVAAKCLHIVNLDSVRALEPKIGAPVDPLRFRPNVVIEGLPAWMEFDLIDKNIRLGGARLEVFRLTERCAATNVDPTTGARDLTIPSFLSRTYGHTDFGVYARVTAAGEVAVGDAVSID